MSARAVVALGSNLGDRDAVLRSAVVDLVARPDVELEAASRPFETAALRVGGVDPEAPPYLNAVVILRTGLTARGLLGVLQGVEAAHGRERAERWGDRTLDADLVAFDDARIEEPDLVVPHPRAHERDFVLVPWLDADPDAVLPGAGPVAAVLARLGSAATGPRPVGDRLGAPGAASEHAGERR